MNMAKLKQDSYKKEADGVLTSLVSGDTLGNTYH